jgi:hypothetical protein
LSVWERHLPWALLKILPVFFQIKREREVGGGSTPDTSRGRDGVC